MKPLSLFLFVPLSLSLSLSLFRLFICRLIVVPVSRLWELRKAKRHLKKKKKRFSEKGSLKASAAALYQPHTTEQHWRLSLSPVLYPTCNTTCHHFLDPSLILFLLPLSISCPEGNCASFNLSVISPVFPPLRLSPAVPPAFPRLLTPSLLFHALCQVSWLFFFFFLFSLCVLCLFTQPSFLLLLSSSVLYRSLGSLSIGTSADASQRQPNKQFCRYA